MIITTISMIIIIIIIALYRYRAAELKHGRIAMLAALGQITQYYVRLGDPVFSQVRLAITCYPSHCFTTSHLFISLQSSLVSLHLFSSILILAFSFTPFDPFLLIHLLSRIFSSLAMPSHRCILLSSVLILPICSLLIAARPFLLILFLHYDFFHI